jgi:hypothetical protein
MANNDDTYVTPPRIPSAFGVMPIPTKSSPRGDPGYTAIGRDSPAAKAALAAREEAKYAPKRKGKR